MLVNRYSLPAEMSYTPRDFDLLLKTTAIRLDLIDKAAEKLTGQLLKWGEFRSPSRVDTLKWYDLTTGREDVQNIVLLVAYNPDALKDAAFRASIQSAINNTDYTSLSLLKESADNLRLGEKTRAELKSLGKLGPTRNWDNADIANYNTLGKGVFLEISPLRWMSANELSNPYFDNLKPNSKGIVWKNGYKFFEQGIDYNDLLGIADARFNDLIATPQGLAYYKDFLDATGGNAEAARTAFVGMIADSLRDRIMNQLNLDPIWAHWMKEGYGGGGGKDPQQILPTRIDWIDAGLGLGIENSGYLLKTNGFSDDLKQTVTRMLGNFFGKKFASKIVEAANQGILDETPADMIRNGMLKEFKRVAGFDANNLGSEFFSDNRYNKGINAALSKMEGGFDIRENDPVFRDKGGIEIDIKPKGGGKFKGYSYKNSSYFVTPETLFVGATGASLRPNLLNNGAFREDTPFALRELIESGEISNVTFAPSSNGISMGGIRLAEGELYIPVQEIEKKLGTGTMWSGNFYTPYLLNSTGVFARESSHSALHRLFGARKQTLINGEGNDEEYYVIPKMYRVFADNPAAVYNINQLSEHSPNYGGVGGTAMTKEMAPISAQLAATNF